MDVLFNYNRIINITFTNEETGDRFEIKCPARGRKPNITIQGTLLPCNFMSLIEIRIINLYIERGRTFQKVEVNAGYENSVSLAFEGEITNIYDESPGPEKVTVITCTQGSLKTMTENTVSIALEKGFTLKNALTQITNAGELTAPIFTFEDNVTSAAPFTFNGTVQEALHQLTPLFPDVMFLFTDKTIKAVKVQSFGNEQPKIIEYLQSPPQIVSTTVVLKAPWNPVIRPGDIVSVQNVSFITRGKVATGSLMNKYRVSSIEFRFCTVQGTNTMTIQGFYPEGSK